ncbi:hypothetical protein GGX14DRAFT_578601 [Mycena pura]|uniref:SnoaL-like domain-containing protein n=1 Tax=Mycena pura TaxID=153505 RepID=A0AAD6UTB8_9AGAR|nr:hypothetical protein GGX14DRAFT_578601 [Mycena pura]
MAANIVAPTLIQFLEGNLKAIYTATDSEAFDDAFKAFLPEGDHATITLNGEKISRAQYKKVLQAETSDATKGTVTFQGPSQILAKGDTQAGTAGLAFTANITKKLIVEGVTVVTSVLIAVIEEHKSHHYFHGVHGGVTDHKRIVRLDQVISEQNN